MRDNNRWKQIVMRCFQVSLVSAFNAGKTYPNFVVVFFLIIILFPAFGFPRPRSYNAQRCIALCRLGASRYPQRVRFLSAHGHSPGTYWPLGRWPQAFCPFKSIFRRHSKARWVWFQGVDLTKDFIRWCPGETRKKIRVLVTLVTG